VAVELPDVQFEKINDAVVNAARIWLDSPIDSELLGENRGTIDGFSLS